jgi:hypothetical protein
MKRKIEMTLEEARKLYENGSDDIKNLLLTTFAKKELGCPKKPNSWEDLEIIEGYYVDDNSLPIRIADETGYWLSSRKIFPKKEQAEASIALAQLLQLMQHPYWNGDWEPNWEDTFVKFYIGFICEMPRVKSSMNSRKLLAFTTEMKAQEFLESYRDLIEIAKPLL